MNVGFFLHFDFSMAGQIYTELKCYNTIFKDPAIEKIYIFTISEKYVKMCKDFDFEYTLVHVKDFSDVEKFKKVDILFTWDWYQSFFAGTISTRAIDLYKMISTYTNEYNRKCIFRICDVKHHMKDYQEMVQSRLDSDKEGKFLARNGPDTCYALQSVKRINYDNVYFLCNGSRTVSDWSWITLTHSIPFLEKEYVQKHSIYLSDDILFDYESAYQKFSYLGIENKIQKLYQVGNLNPGKVKKIKEVMKKNKDMTLVLRLADRSINGSLNNIPSIEMIQTQLVRDEMYQELNSYAVFFFVGKGDDESYYFNKTMYDASIARTAFLIYKKVDSAGIYHELSDYYFDNPEELKTKFRWIQENYQEHLDVQRRVLLKNLSAEKISFVS